MYIYIYPPIKATLLGPPNWPEFSCLTLISPSHSLLSFTPFKCS